MDKIRIFLWKEYKWLLSFLTDKAYVKYEFKKRMGKKLNLKSPKTFSEKLQWLKLYNHKPEFTQLVDKYEVRDHVAKIIGKEYLIPLIGVWDSVDDIDFDKLPNQFVFKPTHTSGNVIICKDKSKFDILSAKKVMKKWLKRNYYKEHREWPYKDVKHRIICEQFIKSGNGSLPTDYKFFCFNGVPDCVMVCLDRETGHPKYYFFNEQWELLKYNIRGKKSPEGFKYKKPEKAEKMFNIAKTLSSNLPFVRVDLYCEGEKIYFGELTFFPTAGCDPNLLAETDKLFGEMIVFNN